MVKRVRRSKGLFSFILAFILILSSTSNVFAADKKFIEQVRKEYTSYEAAAAKNYKTYRDGETKRFEDYKNKEEKSLNLFVTQTDQDLIALDKLLKQDVQLLKKQYGNSSDFDKKIRDYENKINKFYSNSPMNQYNNSINEFYSDSFMNKFGNAINEFYAGSPMHKYGTAVNEFYSNSPMMKYSNAVNRYYSGSPMYRLDNGSNHYYANSIMDQYERGKITKQEAAKQWKALVQKEDKNIKQIISGSSKDLKQVESSAKADILKQKYETVNGILTQRAKSLKEINDTRLEYFGEGISFEPLIPNLGEINVMLNGEWLAFEQPPVILNGSTLVPMRAIFEKLEAEVKWHAQTKTITATKQNINISLTLDKKSAVINGKTISLDTPPKLIGGHTMVPLRFVSESLGAEVKWDGNSQTVFIMK